MRNYEKVRNSAIQMLLFFQCKGGTNTETYARLPTPVPAHNKVRLMFACVVLLKKAEKFALMTLDGIMFYVNKCSDITACWRPLLVWVTTELK
jgi:hypothetical protein